MELTSLNNFFDHIYIITLEREVERQENIVKCLDGLDYSFFYGIDKKSLVLDELIADGTYNEVKTKKLHRFSKPMNTGQVGRSWSHRMVYEDMLKNGFKNALILEDDVTPIRDGLTLFEEAIKELPNDWELIYFDCETNLARNLGTWFKQLGYHIRSLFGTLKWSHKVINNIFARKYSDNLLVAGMHDRSTAYAVSLSAAEKLVKLQTPIAFTSEGLLSYASTHKRLKAFVFKPRTFQKDMKLVAKTLID